MPSGTKGERPAVCAAGLFANVSAANAAAISAALSCPPRLVDRILLGRDRLPAPCRSFRPSTAISCCDAYGVLASLPAALNPDAAAMHKPTLRMKGYE